MPFFGSSLNVGALVEPLTQQMADYLGVPNGLMVKQVSRKSEAATAGIKAFDVILKGGPEPIKTLADWDRTLRANEGKPVQVTILRDRKQQTVMLQVDSKRHRTAMGMEPGADLAAMQEELLGQTLPAAMKLMQEQMETLNGQLEMSPEQMEEMQKQMEQFREEMEEMTARSLGQFV